MAKSGDRNYLLINENSLEKSVNDTFYQRRAHVSRVIVNGIVRTKTDVVKNALDSLLRSHNYGDLLIEISRFKEQLEQCKCFNEVNMHLDTMSTRPDDEGILLTVDVQEKRYLRYFLQFIKMRSRFKFQQVLMCKTKNMILDRDNIVNPFRFIAVRVSCRPEMSMETSR